MASLNTKRLTNATLHRELHRNVYILSLRYTMSNDLSSHFKEGMFEKPNRAAFHYLSYYLMSIIDNKFLLSTSAWAIYEIKMEVDYRGEFVKFINHASKLHEGYISHIIPSWLAYAGGIKVANLMLELSQVALKVYICSKHSKFASLNPSQSENIEENRTLLAKNLIKKIACRQTYHQNMQKAAEIYKHHTPILISDKESKTKLLNEIVQKIVEKSTPNLVDRIKELNNIFTSPSFIKNWCLYIDQELSLLETSWGKHSNLMTNAKKCKSRAEQVVQRHTKRHPKDTVLEYNPSKDKFKLCSVYESDLSPAQYSILRSNVKNGVLDFPNLLKSYAVVISHAFRSFSPPNSDEHFLNIIEEKKKFLFFIRQQSKDLVTEVFRFNNQLKDETHSEILQDSSFHSLPWISETFNIPTIPKMQASYDSNNVEYWSKLFETFKFSQFSYPPNKKITQNRIAAYKVPVSVSHRKQNKSDLCKQLPILSSEKRNIETPIEQPEYMRNIEEIQKNMNKISLDVCNKSNFINSNISTVSFMSATEVKHPKFSSNHIHKLLTSAKKIPATSVKKTMQNIRDKSFQKKWGNLFNDSSDDVLGLHKTASSPDLLIDKKETGIEMPYGKVSIKTNERISGVKEIDYSSFLSGLGSMPDLTISMGNKSKEDRESSDVFFISPDMRSKVLSQKGSAIKDVDTTECTLKTPKDCKKTSLNNKNSVERIIMSYKKLKESLKANEALAKIKADERDLPLDSIIGQHENIFN